MRWKATKWARIREIVASIGERGRTNGEIKRKLCFRRTTEANKEEGTAESKTNSVFAVPPSQNGEKGRRNPR